ncbi:MAG TPA: glycosyltransferase family 2 protein [Patescibacteria group bacterium]|nr:glycosyltransferase family 2 protein [Patescibacteria group bacterium]
MKKVDISIIIVSFNTKDLTLECILSIARTVKKKSFEIIVVDNKSSDDSGKEIKNLESKIKNLKLIQNTENFGFSKANNIGVKESNGRYVLFLNSDTVVYEKTIDGMVEFMDNNPQVGASTCFVRLPNGKLDDAAHRGFPTPWRALAHFTGLSKVFPKTKTFAGYNLTYLPTNQTHEIEALAGAFMVVRGEAGEQVGWWDEDFFFYGEDLDFCYKLIEKGWKIFFVPEFEILHYKGVSGGIKKDSKHITTATRETKKIAHDARFDAMRIFYRKHYQNKYPGYMKGLVLAGISAKKFISGLRS